MVARKRTTLSSPQPGTIISAPLAVFTIDTSGIGQAHVYHYDVAGNQLLADSKTPSKPGDAQRNPYRRQVDSHVGATPGGGQNVRGSAKKIPCVRARETARRFSSRGRTMVERSSIIMPAQ